MLKMTGKKKAGLQRMPVLFICVCILPTLILTLLFTVIPTLRALWMSLFDSTALGMNSTFIGIENYLYMFQDDKFLQALGIIWSFVFHPNMGIVNSLLKFVGLDALARPWVGDAKTALWCIAVTLVWQATGYYMIMHMAAMDGISNEIYEAATIDGASSFRKFISITVPLMSDIIGITFVLAMSGTMNLSFTLSKVMTGGGPNGASKVLLQYMYEQGFMNGNFGYAMAITVFSLTISVILSMISRRLSNREEDKK